MTIIIDVLTSVFHFAALSSVSLSLHVIEMFFVLINFNNNNRSIVGRPAMSDSKKGYEIFDCNWLH